MSPLGWRGLLERTVALPPPCERRFLDALERHELTPREREVAVLLLAGYSTKELCAELGIAVNTYYNIYAGLAEKVGHPHTERMVVVLALLGVERATGTAGVR